jgi:hypothetical protein
MDHGSVYRRCGCRDMNTGRLLGASCPGLGSPGHGSWYFSADLPSAAGQRRRVRRGGFATRTAAAGPEPGLTPGEWLGRWLVARVSLRESTVRSYAAHVRGYLVPYLGGILLAALTPGDVQSMFTAVIRGETVLGRPVSAATLHRIHATLRAALTGAVGAGLIAVNPGRHPELADGRGMDRRPDSAVPAPGARAPAARPAPRRGQPRPGRRAGPEGGRRPARSLQHRAHRRHLYQGCCRTRASGCGSGRAAGPAGRQAPARQREDPPTRRPAQGGYRRLTRQVST